MLYALVEEYKYLLEQQCKTKLKNASILKRLNEIEQAALLINKNINRYLLRLKICTGMDDLDAEQKTRSLSFAAAKNAIEGVTISSETEQEIAEWQTGSKCFAFIFDITLRRYGFLAHN